MPGVQNIKDAIGEDNSCLPATQSLHKEQFIATPLHHVHSHRVRPHFTCRKLSL